jgi:membrane protease YdiL (CAAX protease family)
MSAPRISPWWLVPPTLLFGLNVTVILLSSATTPKNGVYRTSVVAGALVSTLVLGGYAVLAARLGSDDARGALALRRPQNAGRAARLALAAVALITVVSVALEPVLHGDRRQGLTPTRQPHGHEWAVLGAALMVLVLVVPLCEELMFRGLFYNALGRYAVPGSAAAFALAHGIPEVLIQVAVAGLALAEVRRRTDSLWPGVGVHAAVNLLGIVAALATT